MTIPHNQGLRSPLNTSKLEAEELQHEDYTRFHTCQLEKENRGYSLNGLTEIGEDWKNAAWSDEFSAATFLVGSECGVNGIKAPAWLQAVGGVKVLGDILMTHYDTLT